MPVHPGVHAGESLKEKERQEKQKGVDNKGSVRDQGDGQKRQRQDRRRHANPKGTEMTSVAAGAVRRRVNPRAQEEIDGEGENDIEPEKPEKIGVEWTQGLERLSPRFGFGRVMTGEKRLLVGNGCSYRGHERPDRVRYGKRVTRKNGEDQQGHQGDHKSETTPTTQKGRRADEEESPERKRRSDGERDVVGKRETEENQNDDRNGQGDDPLRRAVLERDGDENRHRKDREKATQVKERRDQPGEDRVIAEVGDEFPEHGCLPAAVAQKRPCRSV